MKTTKREVKKIVQACFKPGGFTMDFPEEEAFQNARKAFLRDPWRALYKTGFVPDDQEESETVRWLHRLALAYVRELIAQPALEVTREQTTVPLNEEVSARLLDALPYGLGTEYVTREWLDMAWAHFTQVFQEEIAVYDGTVDVYFAEKLQNLHGKQTEGQSEQYSLIRIDEAALLDHHDQQFDRKTCPECQI